MILPVNQGKDATYLVAEQDIKHTPHATLDIFNLAVLSHTKSTSSVKATKGSHSVWKSSQRHRNCVRLYP